MTRKRTPQNTNPTTTPPPIGGSRPSSRKFQPRVRKTAGQPSHSGTGARSTDAAPCVPITNTKAPANTSSSAVPVPDGHGWAQT
jgi:hypothetical protein